MERKTKVFDDVVRLEGTQPSPDTQYVSPDVAAAEAGEVVDFSMHVNKDEEDTNPTA